MQLQIFETLEMGMEGLLVKRIAHNKRKPVFFDFFTVSTGSKLDNLAENIINTFFHVLIQSFKVGLCEACMGESSARGSRVEWPIGDGNWCRMKQISHRNTQSHK